ncbi:MAG: hypothetical protein QXI58_07250 [Candidatus Micrarchaeia archaeon]
MKVEQIQENQTPKEQDYIELDIDSLIKAGVVEREVEVSGIKFTLRTLTEEERMQVESEVNDNLPIDDIRHLMNLKIPILVRSIVKINGKPINPENREKLRKILYKMQSTVLDGLYLKYTELVRDQLALVELGAKKNGQ